MRCSGRLCAAFQPGAGGSFRLGIYQEMEKEGESCKDGGSERESEGERGGGRERERYVRIETER